MKRSVFPFSALVGQEDMLLGLILNVINPLIGGVLIRGERGTGKSTAVRSLAHLLPKIKVAKGCVFNCDPYNSSIQCDFCKMKYSNGELETEVRKMRVIEVPLSCSEDRLVGSLDIEKAIKEGLKALHPGILAAANRQILYVDEINLLTDHIVDDLLDSAAMGVNTIEREGISVTHPSRFILIGSMNPDEGELRPQILDRLGLMVDIEPVESESSRVEIVRRVERFDEDASSLIEEFAEKERLMQERIINGERLITKGIKISEFYFTLIVKMCIDLNVATHRGEIVIVRCAKALAALNNRSEVNQDDILTAAKLALGHRIEGMGLDREQIKQKISDSFDRSLRKTQREEEEESEKDGGEGESGKNEGNNEMSGSGGGDQKNEMGQGGAQQSADGKLEDYEIGEPEEINIENFNPELNEMDETSSGSAEDNQEMMIVEDAAIGVPDIEKNNKPPKSDYEYINELSKNLKMEQVVDFGMKRAMSQKRGPMLGKRMKKKGEINKGRYVKYRKPKCKVKSLAIDATIRAAAPYQMGRDKGGLAFKIELDDIREKVFEYQTPLSIVFLLDASGSMYELLMQMKGVIMNLHSDAYRNRDRAGLVVFQQLSARVLQYPTVNLNLVVDCLDSIESDSYTPLASGLIKALEIFKMEKIKSKEVIPCLVVLTDGGANIPNSSGAANLKFGRSRSYQLIESEIREISEKIKKEDISTVVLWPESARKKDPSYRKNAFLIAQSSGGQFYEIQT